MIGGGSFKYEHKAILEAQNLTESDALYAASIEGLVSPNSLDKSKPYLVLHMSGDREAFIQIRVASDLHIPNLSSADGRQILEQIFGKIKGVAVHVPEDWS